MLVTLCVAIADADLTMILNDRCSALCSSISLTIFTSGFSVYLSLSVTLFLYVLCSGLVLKLVYSSPIVCLGCVFVIFLLYLIDPPLEFLSLGFVIAGSTLFLVFIVYNLFRYLFPLISTVAAGSQLLLLCFHFFKFWFATTN